MKQPTKAVVVNQPEPIVEAANFQEPTEYVPPLEDGDAGVDSEG